jgi:OmpA-OmpF porin, OOP family
MRRVCTVVLSYGLMSLPGVAQSVTLEEFDLGAPEAPANLADCLLAQTGCAAGISAAGADLTLEDVSNIELVKRSTLGKNLASTAGAATTVLPSIDMEILFDYNADSIRPDQEPRLRELAKGLAASEFAGYTLAFIGHSDAKGGADYNRALSTRRALAVADFVSAAAAIGRDRITAAGLGADRLKSPDDPYGAENRRVQLVLIPR